MRVWQLSLLPILFLLLSLTSRAQNDIVVYETYMSEYLPSGEYPLTVYFYNNGAETLDNFVVNWSLNGGATQSEFIDLDALNTPIVPSPILHACTTEGTFEITQSAGATQQLSVWITQPNGEYDVTSNNNSDVHMITTLENHCQRKVLLEPHLSIDSSYGPDVELVIDAFKSAYPDNLLVATWHTDDAMWNEQNEELDITYDIGHTYALVDRHLFPPVYEGQTNKPVVHYDDWQDYLPLRFERYSPVHLATDNTFNSATGELTVNITATFLSDVTGDFRFNCYLLEDPVIGDGLDGSYGQINRYSADGPASGGPEHPHYNSPTIIMDFPHRNVVWDRLGGTWGTQGVIPSFVPKNTVITHTYTYNVPADYDYNELSLITMVQKYDPNTDYRDILNALDCPMNGSNQHQWITDTAPVSSIPYYTLGGKVLLEGAYSGSGMMHTSLNTLIPTNQPYSDYPYNYNGNQTLQTSQSNIVDWVMIEARSGIPNTAGIAQGTQVVETQVGVLLADGSFADINGNPGVKFYDLVEGQEYYFCVRHRNHLDLFTTYPTYAAANMYYDFTSSVTMALGIEQQKMSYDGKALMLSGDYNQDGIIQVSDVDVWQAQPAASNMYMNTDGNLDGSVQATDFDAWFYNKAKIGSVEIGHGN